MKTENTLARNLDFAADKASYDAACKRLLANKEILAWIMKKAVLRNIENAVLRTLQSIILKGNRRLPIQQ